MRRVALERLGRAPRILISRTDALGDLILCTPVFRALKQALPDSKLSLLCRKYTAPALALNPHIDQIVEIESENFRSESQTVSQIRAERFDIGIALFPSKFTARLFRKARIPVRIGSARRFHSWQFTHHLPHSRRQNLCSEAEYNLDLLEPLGIQTDDIRPEVFVSAAEVVSARSVLRARGIIESFIALHPGSAGSSLNWPLEKFIDLALALRKSGKQTVFTGDRTERERIASASATCEMEIFSLAGKTDLRELAATLSLASVVVSNSTGPLHLAAALGTPTVGLFPPVKSMSPIRWSPPVDNTFSIQPELVACNCRNGVCKGQGNESANCMEKISVEEIVTAITTALAATDRSADIPR